MHLKHLGIATAFIVSLVAIPLRPAPADAALWSANPAGAWNCSKPSNECVAHTGFNPNVRHWGAFAHPLGNCTNYAAFRLITNGASTPIGGNATDWMAKVPRSKVNGTPAVGAIAWWPKTHGVYHGDGAGHVAYVEKVQGAVVYLSESTWASGSSRRAVRKGEPGWPVQFLHVKDMPAGRSPIGRYERARGLSGGRITIEGWAFDPDRADKPVQVEAWVGGQRGQAGARRAYRGYATLTRNDVARVHSKAKAGSKHGFKVTLKGFSPGRHEIRVYALNRFAGGDVTHLGGRTARVPSTPADEPGLEDPVGEDPVGDDPGAEPPAGVTQGSQAWAEATGAGYHGFLGDFNGDGHVDIGVRRLSDGDFYWRLGPTFTQGTLQGWADGAHFQGFMGDFNSDGQVDVGVRRTTDGDFYWRFGPDFGQVHYGWAAGAQYEGFVGDFNRDGQVDVGLRRTTDGSFYWRLGPGFAPGSHHGWAGGTQYQGFLGDFNRDGQIDVGVRRSADGSFFWRLGVG